MSQVLELFRLNDKIALVTGAASGLGAAIAIADAGANVAVPAQNPLQTKPDISQLEALTTEGKALLEKARSNGGSAVITLQSYNGHHTMLTARTASGGAEQHMHFADFLIVLDGSGTELTGGTIVDFKPGSDGENHGTKLEGATPHTHHKGDVLHIPAGTPHQAIEAPGEAITILVIKVEEPAS